MGKIVLVSFTSINSAGGVPRWNRDFMNGFKNSVHFSWQDVVDIHGDCQLPEWEKARILSRFLISNNKIDDDDIIIADGFWADGYNPERTLSICHGIWSHLIKEEADAGREPDFPLHHAVQVDYRRSHLARGGRLVAVSQFIQHQMDIQWGFKSTVINNAIDLDEFEPAKKKMPRDRPLIIHGVNDKNNKNKGWDHIQYLKENIDATVWSLDEAHKHINVMLPGMRTRDLDKYEALAQADLVVIPSAYEGNSYFALEAMACDVPIVTYDVGLFYEISKMKEGLMSNIGPILLRRLRSEKETLDGVNYALRKSILNGSSYWDHTSSREVAKNYSIQKFHEQWKDYLKEEFNYEH